MRQPWESRDYDAPEWQPAQSGPEYHLNKNAAPRCTLCNMAMQWDMDDDGPFMRCANRRCKLYHQPERP